jgi:hypothetical protein
MENRQETTKEPRANTPAAAKSAGARKQPGGETSTTAKNQGAATGGNGGEKDLLQHAKNATGEIMNQVQQRAGSQLTQQKESAATDLTKVVNAVRRFGETLTADQGGPIARYAAEYGDKAADSLERFGSYIREQDPKQLLTDVQNFGRRRPALLLGGAFLLGFAGARLIRSSMEAGSQQSSNSNLAGRRNVGIPNQNVQTPNVPTARPSQTPNAL